MKDLRIEYRLMGHLVRSQLEAELPDYALEHLAPAFDRGDPEAAAWLVGAAPNGYRGLIALAAYWSGVPNPAYRTLLAHVWDHDHQHLVAAARGGAPQIRRMMRRAEFPVPFSGALRVYRGGRATETSLARGLSWTVDRDCACWFAFKHHGRRERVPLVLCADVTAADVVLWHDGRSEKEVVLGSTPAWRVDPDGGTWEDAAGRHADRIHGWNAALMDPRRPLPHA